jgi:hypothetical protein
MITLRTVKIDPWVAKFENFEVFEISNSFQCSFIIHHLPTSLERRTDEKRG